MKTLKVFSVIFFALTLYACTTARDLSKGKDVSPYDYGLKTAKTEIERYEVLLKVHRAAVVAGVNVDYSGIDTIRLEIPTNPSRIPLTNYNDFKGCVFVIKNNSKNTYLFNKTINGNSVEIDKRLIDSGDFRTHNFLNQGRYLLIIEDEKPWVQNRRGYDYGHKRKDILLIENGIAKNAVIKPYNNIYSSPKCSYVKLEHNGLVIKNLIIERDPSCTCLTNIVSVAGHDNVLIQNVCLYTPPNDLVNDRAFTINNCTNVILKDLQIEGTYSQKNYSGYGVNMNNIWNFKATGLHCNGNWGIFGNNNINLVNIEDSQINRFDIHCYGKDVVFNNTTFFNLYNQFSSVFGDVKFYKCTFKDFVPVLIETSYNAYTEFDLTFDNCIFYSTATKNYLIDIGGFDGENNPRYELSEKKLPKIHIKKLKNISLETGKEKKEIQLYLDKGNFIREHSIDNIMKL